MEKLSYNEELGVVDSFYQLIGREYFHLGETKPLLSQVFDRCSDVIDIIVDAKKAVVGQPKHLNVYRCILGIVPVYIQLKLPVYLLCIDDGRDTFLSFVKQCQNRFIHIVVNKDDTLICTLNQIGNESIGIINLAIISNVVHVLRLRSQIATLNILPWSIET